MRKTAQPSTGCFISTFLQVDKRKVDEQLAGNRLRFGLLSIVQCANPSFGITTTVMANTDSSSRLDDPAQKMDRMYRWTRHVYDSTRRYYLLGRDQMLDHIADRPAGAVLEMGCGTARNLRVLDEKAPQHSLYGIDASLAMLATARDKLERDGCTDSIRLAQGLAQELNPKQHFGVDGPFDVIFFSYVLSMIPSWPEALDAALKHLSPDGRLYIVDFWDQEDLPAVVAAALQSWLSLFDVKPRPGLIDTLRRLEAEGRVSCTIAPVARRYAYLATVSPQSGDRGSEISNPFSLQAVAETELQWFGSEEVIPA